MSELRQFCTFLLEGRLYGIEVERVQEVMSAHEITRLPARNAAIRGLLNLRGQIVPVVDLRHCLGLPARPAGAQPANVVVRSAEGAISLWVDEIGDVLEVSQDDFERPPAALNARGGELIRGAYKLENRLLLVLDIARTLQSATV